MPPRPSNSHSPRLARAVLSRCLPSGIREPIIGDFEESYHDVTSRRGPGRAALWYWGQTFQSVSAHLAGAACEQLQTVCHLFENSAATIVRHRRYSVISTVGLALAFTCCLLLSLYVAHELSFDRYHQNADRIFRVVTNQTSTIPGILVPTYPSETPVYNETYYDINTMPGLLAPILQKEDPDVVRATRIFPSIFGKSCIVRGGRTERTFGVMFGDSETFDIFSWPLIKRVDGPLLDDPFTIVITRSAAARFFGAADPIGDVITIDGHDFVVTGVAEDIPSNSHFRFEFMASYDSSERIRQDNGNNWLEMEGWNCAIAVTYLLLDEPSRAGLVAGRIDELLSRQGPHAFSGIELQPLKEIYLGRPGRFRAGSNGNSRYLIATALAALLILVVAGVNVVNMVLASWHKDSAADVEEAKLLSWPLLFRRFASEALLITALAVTVALVTSKLLVPLFNSVVEKDLSPPLNFVPWILLCVVLFSAALGVVAASFPTAFLAKHRAHARRPAGLGEYHFARYGGLLVSFQFVLASVLMFSVLLMATQLRAVRTQQLGYDMTNLLVLPTKPSITSPERARDLKYELLGLSGVVSGTVSDSAPGCVVFDFLFRRVRCGEANVTSPLGVFCADTDFLETYQIPLLSQDTLSYQPGNTFYLSAAAARALGWDDPNDAVGKPFDIFVPGDTATLVVSGVFEDFNHYSLHFPRSPLMIVVEPYRDPWFLTLRLDSARSESTMASIAGVWERFHPDVPYRSYFLQEDVFAPYEADHRTARQFAILAIAVFVIACGGLLGLTSYTIDRRRDDIRRWRSGGLGTFWIILRLCWPVAALLAVATSVSVPLAREFMSRWLGNFTCHVDLGPGFYLLVGGAIVLIGLAVAMIPTARAAFSNRLAAVSPTGHWPDRMVRLK